MRFGPFEVTVRRRRREPGHTLAGTTGHPTLVTPLCGCCPVPGEPTSGPAAPLFRCPQREHTLRSFDRACPGYTPVPGEPLEDA